METGWWGDDRPARQRGGSGPWRVLTLRGEGSVPLPVPAVSGGQGPRELPRRPRVRRRRSPLAVSGPLWTGFGETGGSEGQGVASETRGTLFIHPPGTWETMRPPCLRVVSCKCPFNVSCNLGDCIWLAVLVSFRILV